LACDKIRIRMIDIYHPSWGGVLSC
jgi:hypothetical protein